MSDPLDTLLTDMLNTPLPYLADDGFSTAVLTRIAEAQLRRGRFVTAALASIACVLFALVSALALRSQVTASPTAAAILPVAASLAIGVLILSRSIQVLFQE